MRVTSRPEFAGTSIGSSTSTPPDRLCHSPAAQSAKRHRWANRRSSLGDRHRIRIVRTVDVRMTPTVVDGPSDRVGELKGARNRPCDRVPRDRSALVARLLGVPAATRFSVSPLGSKSSFSTGSIVMAFAHACHVKVRARDGRHVAASCTLTRSSPVVSACPSDMVTAIALTLAPEPRCQDLNCPVPRELHRHAVGSCRRL